MPLFKNLKENDCYFKYLTHLDIKDEIFNSQVHCSNNFRKNCLISYPDDIIFCYFYVSLVAWHVNLMLLFSIDNIQLTIFHQRFFHLLLHIWTVKKFFCNKWCSTDISILLHSLWLLPSFSSLVFYSETKIQTCILYIIRAVFQARS